MARNGTLQRTFQLEKFQSTKAKGKWLIENKMAHKLIIKFLLDIENYGSRRQQGEVLNSTTCHGINSFSSSVIQSFCLIPASKERLCSSDNVTSTQNHILIIFKYQQY